MSLDYAPAGPAPKFSCASTSSDASSFSRLGILAVAAPVAKSAPAPGLKAPSLDSVKADTTACRQLDDILSVQQLGLFVSRILGTMGTSPPEDAVRFYDALKVVVDAMVAALQPMAIQAAGTCTTARTAVRKSELRDALAAVRAQVITSNPLSTEVVDASLVRDAQQSAPLPIKVVVDSRAPRPPPTAPNATPGTSSQRSQGPRPSSSGHLGQRRPTSVPRKFTKSAFVKPTRPQGKRQLPEDFSAP